MITLWEKSQTDKRIHPKNKEKLQKFIQTQTDDFAKIKTPKLKNKTKNGAQRAGKNWSRDSVRKL